MLAADDVEINRLILEDLLVHEGAQSVFAENGEQALRCIEEAGEHAFDVVLMDVQMPVMDGHIATQRIHEIAPELPVTGLTSHALAEEKAHCLASGMVEHVTKPIDVDVLVEAIQQSVKSSDPMPFR
ncbi:MAG: response regulator [gamma proteobacterium endosymbiont of Lamellibrachia anaximandri]|nr:response regulator [gamma proteobacterium endosymbiont of Lamellibrachia anaximandri]